MGGWCESNLPSITPPTRIPNLVFVDLRGYTDSEEPVRSSALPELFLSRNKDKKKIYSGTRHDIVFFLLLLSFGNRGNKYSSHSPKLYLLASSLQ